MDSGCFGFDRRDGHYESDGYWTRHKYCFIDCGERCTCRPPGDAIYSPAHDVRLQAMLCAGICIGRSTWEQ